MLSFTNPFRWRIWPLLWDSISNFMWRINSFLYHFGKPARPTLDEDAEGTATQFQRVSELRLP